MFSPFFFHRTCTFARRNTQDMKETTSIHSPILYLQHQYELLKMEYEYEKEQFKQQTELMGIGRKVKRGMCWYR